MNMYWLFNLPIRLFGLLIVSFEPVTEGQKALHAEAYREFDRIVELGRIRLQSVTAGLPAPLWSAVLVGAFLNIAVTWFFDMRSRSMHMWMTAMFSCLLGLLIFLLVHRLIAITRLSAPSLNTSRYDDDDENDEEASMAS